VKKINPEMPCKKINQTQPLTHRELVQIVAANFKLKLDAAVTTT